MTELIASWESFYSNSAVLRTMVGFAHVAGLLVGGGAAIAADRAALTIARRSDADRSGILASIRSTHSVVLAGLAAVVLSGVLLLAADAETLLHSTIFWTKMALMVLLLANGALVTRAERRAMLGTPDAWKPLQWSAGVSLALWLLTTLAGTALLNAS